MSESDLATAAGGCLCGGVRYEVTGPLRPVVACHCEQCRRQSGNFVAATAAKRADVRIVKDDGLTWYRSSGFAERGFCRTCGGNLFWRRDGDDEISITAGTLDAPTGLSTVMNIGMEFKGDYYDVPADAPQMDGFEYSTPEPNA